MKQEVEWIPCSQSLPWLYDNVLITDALGEVLMAHRVDDDMWCRVDGPMYNISHNSVMAWMPKPRPYTDFIYDSVNED